MACDQECNKKITMRFHFSHNDIISTSNFHLSLKTIQNLLLDCHAQSLINIQDPIHNVHNCYV